MREKERIAAPTIGGTSLLVIFGVLCLVVLSLLSLSTALAEKRLSDAGAEAVTAYYAAEIQAQTILARLRNGETVESVEIQEEQYRFRCPISQNQRLEVVLQKEVDRWHILRWQAVAFPEETEYALPVWQGG